MAESAVAGVDAATNAPVLAWWGQSESAPDALYALDPKSGRSTMLDRPSAHRFENIKLGECKEWSCTTSRGDEVIGVYFLPDNFDPSKKYPLIVNYYGGCTLHAAREPISAACVRCSDMWCFSFSPAVVPDSARSGRHAM